MIEKRFRLDGKPAEVKILTDRKGFTTEIRIRIGRPEPKRYLETSNCIVCGKSALEGHGGGHVVDDAGNTIGAWFCSDKCNRKIDDIYDRKKKCPCGKPATFWPYYIYDSNRHRHEIGFCSWDCWQRRKWNKNIQEKSLGYYGKWKPWMGKHYVVGGKIFEVKT